jgi:non-ribosomal peptide synthetase component E (peptide arylation enzyme)
MGGSQPAALVTLLKPSTVAAYVAAGFWGDETIYHVAARHAPALPQAFAVRDRHRGLNYSNPPARRSASCQPMIRSTTSSISAGDHVTAAEHRARRSQTFQVWTEISSMGWH